MQAMPLCLASVTFDVNRILELVNSFVVSAMGPVFFFKYSLIWNPSI